MAQQHPRSRAFVWTLAVCLLLTASLVVALTGDPDWLLWNDDAEAQPTVGAAVTPPPPLVLTSADKVIATDVALADPRVQAMLVGHEYAVGEIGQAFGEGQEFVGVTVDISLNGPTRITGEWASSAWVDCDTEAIPPRVPVPYRATYDDVTGVLVLVNLGARQVDVIGPRARNGATLIGDQEFIGEHRRIEDCRME